MVRCIRRIPNRHAWDSGDASSPLSSHSAARCGTYGTWARNGVPVLRATMTTLRSSRNDNRDEGFTREGDEGPPVQVRKEDNIAEVDGRRSLCDKGGGAGCSVDGCRQGKYVSVPPCPPGRFVADSKPWDAMQD